MSRALECTEQPSDFARVELGSVEVRTLDECAGSPRAGLVVLSATDCVLVFATHDVQLPYWIDAERGELIFFAGFGAGAAVSAGGGPHRPLRALLAAALLAVAMAVQYMLIALITTSVRDAARSSVWRRSSPRLCS